MTRAEQVAWAAGFIDGEGCIRVVSYQRKPCKNGTVPNVSCLIHLGVGQADCRKVALDRLQALFGGYIYKRSKRPVKWKQIYNWNIFGKHAFAALMEMWPYFVAKRNIVTHALMFHSWKQEVRKLRPIGTRMSQEEVEMYPRVQTIFAMLNKRGFDSTVMSHQIN